MPARFGVCACLHAQSIPDSYCFCRQHTRSALGGSEDPPPKRAFPVVPCIFASIGWLLTRSRLAHAVWKNTWFARTANSKTRRAGHESQETPRSSLRLDPPAHFAHALRPKRSLAVLAQSRLTALQLITPFHFGEPVPLPGRACITYYAHASSHDQRDAIRIPFPHAQLG
jgi:hypothetical protein